MEITNESNGARKSCAKCKQEQPGAAFSKRRINKDGLKSQCKKCDKAHYEANKEEILAEKKVYYEDNRERILASVKAYYETNKEEVAAYSKAWREANKEKAAAGRKVWRKANPDLIEVRNVIHRANRGDIPSLEIYGLPDRESVKQVRIGKLAIYKKHFGKKKYHLDHMQPLAGAKGDTEELHRRSHFTNLIYIPAKINLSKHAKPFWEWYMSLEPGPLKRCIIQQANYNDMIEKQLSIKIVEDIAPIDDQPELGS